MAEKFDLIVIGAGPGGYVAAIRAAQLGLKVACIEREAALGGTCLRIGCIPSKALLESSELFEKCRHLTGHGIRLHSAELDLAAMLKRKDQVVFSLTKGIESLFKKNKITRFTGTGRIAAPGRVAITTSSEQLELEAPRILIATGSKPSSLPGVEMDGDLIGSSTQALAYPAVPARLIVIGAGYIGLELGSVWRRLGAKVTFVEFLPRILPGLDADIAADAQKLFEKQGLEFKLGCKVKSARVVQRECAVETEGVGELKADRVLVAVGRSPNTEGLDLEKVGVKTDPKGRILVNESFESSVPGIYAVGDVIPGPMLAHKAEEEGIACVEKIVTGHGHLDYDTIPAVVYTHPEIATVGKTEDQLKEHKIAYRKGIFPFRGNGRAHSLGEVEGKIKVLADEKGDRILGVHIIGPRAGDLIAEAAAAMSFGASSEDLARVCHAHPTLAEALKEAALAVDQRAIHA